MDDSENLKQKYAHIQVCSAVGLVGHAQKKNEERQINIKKER